MSKIANEKADLIDRAALDIDAWERLSDAVCALEKAPAVDAVEVVRCEKCIGRTTWIRSADGAANICGMSGMFPRGETDYCSYSERRTDGSTDRR